MCMNQQASPQMSTGVTPDSPLGGVVPGSAPGPASPDDAPTWAKIVQAGAGGALSGWQKSQQPANPATQPPLSKPQPTAQPNSGAIPALAQTIMANYLKRFTPQQGS